ncbi:efflux RND transporter periplasmic adaptor subunit [Alloalcanivorax xenomutans]|uniref:efflux RND transporter periplasmic adaptor subunit n=1 Tax=Alloalcanivorax xenomutans TaxID=1094342 RepID=UPI0013D435F7|nr:efflux RND transporter periplasmic adaptor subunit [Alloalcanivorax xenomutans]WOA30399.1 efflux RND transporter periplasmic adaptor subunit [Alloalcanivorax xenomutans]
MSRSSRGLASVALVCGLGMMWGCAETQPEPEARPAPVKVITVGEASEREFQYPGRVAATSRSQLAFRVSGQLIELPVHDGQRVEKGALLARLDPRDFQNQLKERRADAELVDKQYQRGVTLARRGVIAESELDELRARRDQARASLNLARDNLSYTRLTAPFDGVVASTEQENHQFVQARDPVLHLQSSDTIDIHFSVPEHFIRETVPFDDDFSVEVVFPGRPEQRFRAVYREHETRPGSAQAYNVALTLPAPETFRVLPGMSVTVLVDPAQMRADRAPLLRVPVAAVFTRDGQAGAWVWRYHPDSQTVRAQPVELGDIADAGVAIRSGVQVGDRIVIAGVHALQEGQTVREMTRERGL